METICEIKAGKCTVEGNLVSPDERKGILRLVMENDGLLRVQWSNRNTGMVEDDLFVIHDAYLSKVDACTTGQVYLLKFISSDVRMLFWMQEINQEVIKNFVAKFNETTASPLT
ncbi:Proteasomal ubiquitin receptor ADRM1 homolog [Babesia microti strain RI]|uniref:Proteasomal ubiquitin receptor ADRM1 homolog n=1 Tax=Babesia microti (strain RI) TaxID=1133968 RepID=A0A0K3ARH8_BABMR|nr:Proteasomal ubiquitin receptor ADRM1 homolog [Babesia microti strain RI]CTQ41055.1 Proteasomal ubiquitin receptor ADRM1 homolog [Babesia microti strain RI]|eukprot:XP_012649066.1 Proteasomal ubiquitin receptor ADRM1 homolog [Babesia microti strain RI]